MSLVYILKRELAFCRQRPGRVFDLFSTRKLLRKSKKWKIQLQYAGQKWVSSEAHFSKRPYKNYEEYVAHQKSKLQTLDLSAYDQTFRTHLHGRLKEFSWLCTAKTALCLAARIGTEVKAFHDCGIFAVGIDLNPGEDNKYVLKGDFHNLQFPSECIDVVYSNSLDHAFDLEKVLKEAKRVLRSPGYFIVEAMKGDKEGLTPDEWASTSWEKVEDLKEVFIQSGFTFFESKDFQVPWRGECLVFQFRK